MDKRILLLFSAILLITPRSVYAELNIDTGSPFLYPQHSKKISMDLQDARIVDVLKIFSQQSSLNLITAENIVDKRVTVYFDNVPVEQALQQLLRANNLTYELQPESNIYIVKPLIKPEIELITRVYNLKHASVSSSKLKSIIDIKIEEDSGSGDSGSSSSSQGSGSQQDDGTTGIVAAVEKLLTEQGRIVEDPRTNSIMVSDIASNFRNIENTIAKLDVPIPQILIEVEMLDVNKSVADLIGIKPGSTPLTFSGGQREVLYPWDQNKVLDKGFTFSDEYTAGLVDASGLTATLQFLRTQTDTKNLARPRILTLNNETAQIKIATNEAIGSETLTSGSNTVSTQSVEAEREETGVILTVTPQANLLTGEITMAVIPRVIITRAGNSFGGVTFRDPEERGSKSILRVQSGDTIIIGGLMRSDSTVIESKMPILGDIPFIGRAFRHNNETVTDRELIIFITPHIINETPLPKTAAASNDRLIREQGPR